jgi:hypothetical protein
MNYDSTEAGMTITIAVICQNCDRYLNTLGRDGVHAKINAKSLGWAVNRKTGWLCPDCVEADK